MQEISQRALRLAIVVEVQNGGAVRSRLWGQDVLVVSTKVICVLRALCEQYRAGADGAVYHYQGSECLKTMIPTQIGSQLQRYVRKRLQVKVHYLTSSRENT